jgi:K+-transporting ATPase ATPase C chain
VIRHIRTALLLLAVLSLVTGVLYPAAVTAVARLSFRGKAEGSLISRGGRIVGSALIGQPFESPRYFRGRPSATFPGPYNGGASSGSNLGPTNPALAGQIRERAAALRILEPARTGPIPVDLLTTSGSGLDPHISPAAALWQVPSVARSRGLPEATVRELVLRHVEGRDLGFLGEPRVNVLRLNLALDKVRGESP